MKRWQTVLGSLIVGLMVSTHSNALIREPNSSITRTQCEDRVKSGSPSGIARQAGLGNDITLIEKGDGLSEMCVFDRRGTQQTLVIAPTGTVSYPRDTLTLNHSLGKQTLAVNLWISGTESDQPPYFGGTTPWTMGQDVTIDLPVLTTINGQSIYQLDDDGAVGLRLWTGTNDAPLLNRDDTSTQVNNGYKIPHNRNLGDHFGVIRTNSHNFAFQLRYEVILLKPDAVGRVITVPAKRVGTLKLHTTAFDKISGKIDYPITFRATSFTFIPRTCSYSGAVERVVKMNKIGVGHFHNRDEVYGGETVLNLNCGAGANVDSHITFTDAADNSNTSDALKLLPEAVNAGTKGLQVRLYKDSETTPISFGPIEYSPSTTAILKKDYQKQVGTKQETSGNSPQNYSIKLTAKYLKTGEISPGPVKTAAMFTFSYY